MDLAFQRAQVFSLLSSMKVCISLLSPARKAEDFCQTRWIAIVYCYSLSPMAVNTTRTFMPNFCTRIHFTLWPATITVRLAGAFLMDLLVPQSSTKKGAFSPPEPNQIFITNILPENCMHTYIFYVIEEPLQREVQSNNATRWFPKQFINSSFALFQIWDHKSWLSKYPLYFTKPFSKTKSQWQ